jgi:hypothetical protein
MLAHVQKAQAAKEIRSRWVLLVVLGHLRYTSSRGLLDTEVILAARVNDNDSWVSAGSSIISERFPLKTEHAWIMKEYLVKVRPIIPSG